MAEPVYLVDGSGYIFRAFYGVAPLTTKAGFPTNGLFGFTRMLKKLLSEAKSDNVAVVFDSGRETFRKELYVDYKANRTTPPDELIQQFPYFPKIARALGLPVLDLPGYEADDIIGTLTHRMLEAGQEVIIVSGDKDFMQLIQPGVTIWDTMHDRRIGPEQVKDKFGVLPHQVVDVLALIGDSSDNVPGLSGVGPKTAAQLIEKFGDLETILSSAAAILEDSSIRNRKTLAAKIELEAETVRLSQKLVRIVTDAPVELARNGSTHVIASLDAATVLTLLKRGDPVEDELRELIEKLQFESLLGQIPKAVKSSQSFQDQNYNTVLPVDFPSFIEKLKVQTSFSFDLETTSLDPLQAELVGASFCWSENEAFYIPLAHKVEVEQVGSEKFLAATKEIFENPKIGKNGQNLKYDCKILSRRGVQVAGIKFDTMIAAYLLNPDRGSYNLTTLASEFLSRAVIEFDEVTEGNMDFASVPLDKATRYACQDAHFAWLIERQLSPRIAEAGLKEVLERIELPLLSVLGQMELEGVMLDIEYLAKLSQEFAERLGQLEKDIYEIAGQEFNINSPKQVGEILFNKLQIPTKGVKRTKTGYSTDSGVLEKLALQHPLPAKMLDYRVLHKLKSTYVDTLPAQVSAVSKRLHTSFNQTVTATGRLSSSDPNLQNIPISGVEGIRIRSAFVAPPGKVLISADYSQIELRLLAHISEDAAMSQAFRDDIDIHAQTARELLNLSPGSEVSSEDRRIGKTINFGIVYGMGPFRLARDLGINYGSAEEYISRYFEHYAGVKRYFAETEKQALTTGEVATIFGRKRVLKDIDSGGRDQGFLIRAALNAPIQGSAADIIKLAMIRVSENIAKNGYPIKLLLQIHDELVFEVEQGFAEEARALIVKDMEEVVTLRVPMKVDAGIGKNWQEAHR